MNIRSAPAATYHFETSNGILAASWPHHVQSESPEFLQSVKILFGLVRDQHLTRLFIDSGTPQGGTLTEELIACMKQELGMGCSLRKVALLESVDYHWDNNIMQVFNYLRMTLGLEVEIRMFSSRELAFHWLEIPGR
ncbi:MAG: hypothetical protein ACO1O1_02910 [Adhaeribacter sp.]